MSIEPPNRQTFVVELKTDGDVTGREIFDVLDAVGYHVVEVDPPVMRSVTSPKKFYCGVCEVGHRPPLHVPDRESHG